MRRRPVLAPLPVEKMVSKRALVGPLGFSVLRGDALASPVSAALQDILSIGRPHTDTKAVRLASLSVIGLKSSFHGLYAIGGGSHFK